MEKTSEDESDSELMDQERCNLGFDQSGVKKIGVNKF